MPTRSRVGWWLFILVLGAFMAFVFSSFIGMIVLAVFAYYATRPICRQLARVVDSDGIAAGLTVLLLVVPIVLLVVYTGYSIVQQLQGFIGSGSELGGVVDLSMLPNAQRETVQTLLQNPQEAISQPQQVAQTALSLGSQAFGGIAGGLVLIGLALTLVQFLLTNDDQLADGFATLVGGRDTTAYGYAAAVDEDLESVFFGNLLFVGVMAVIAGIVYEATNLLAPGELTIPLVFVLAVLTGLTSLIPIVVSKVIYLPIVAYLGIQAFETSGTGALVFVGGALVVYFFVLDILPQTFIQPVLTGRQLDVVVIMFAYLLGPILFGWYGFFFLPIMFVAVLEAVRIVLPELVRGEPLTPTVSMGSDIGTSPQTERDDVTGDSSPNIDTTNEDSNTE